MAGKVLEPEGAQSDLSGVLRYVARQPILDMHNRVHGYELLFRAGPEAAFRGDGNFATRTMLDNTVVFGLDKLTAGLPAFVNCTTESLTEHMVDVLPPSMTVLEVLETLDPTPKLIAACKRLKSAGFRIALDDFVWSAKFVPLVELANYIKVDFVLMGPAERKELLKKLNGMPVALVAEKVETEEEHKQACSEGFTLFQGYYFCRPQLMKNRKIPANRFSHLQILEVLQHDPLDLQRLSQLVKQDTALTYRFLRLVNSPIAAMRQEIRSVQSALLAVGDDAVRRIATLAIASEMNAHQPPEVLRMSFVRGRFCELAAGLCALEQGEQYLLGMFSLLPAMLRVSMSDLAHSLPLRERIREALQGAISLESSLLRWTIGYERGEWVYCDSIAQSYGLDQDELTRCYGEAVVWAEEALNFAS